MEELTYSVIARSLGKNNSPMRDFQKRDSVSRVNKTVKIRAVESESLKVGKSLKIG